MCDPSEHDRAVPSCQVMNNKKYILFRNLFMRHIFVAELFAENEQSRICFVGCLHERLCTEVAQGGSLHLGWEAVFSEFVLAISWYCIHRKSSQLGKVTMHQVLRIPEVVIFYIIHSLRMQSDFKPGHSAFLSTPNEVMLLLSIVISKYTEARIFNMSHVPTCQSLHRFDPVTAHREVN